jgi:hypothetical protein
MAVASRSRPNIGPPNVVVLLDFLVRVNLLLVLGRLLLLFNLPRLLGHFARTTALLFFLVGRGGETVTAAFPGWRVGELVCHFCCGWDDIEERECLNG